jgi:hypothetical protein
MNSRREDTMAFRRHRDWTQSTISKAHDTRELTQRGGSRRGNVGSLTFSISLGIGGQFLARFCNGHEHTRVRLELNGSGILMLPANSGEVGRRFSFSTYKQDYRAFFDAGNYPWIEPIKPFGATYTPVKLTDRGLYIPIPPEKDRKPIEPYIQYKPRSRRAYPLPQNLPVAQQAVKELTEVLPPSSGQLYLVMVPRETDEQFHTLLRFLKLEALKE